MVFFYIYYRKETLLLNLSKLSETPSSPFFEQILDNFRAKLGFSFLGFQALNLHTIKALTLLFLFMSLRSQAKSGKKRYFTSCQP
jgi:hypothetical protein